MSAEQQRVLDAILSGPRGNLDGPFLAWIHSPGLADHAQELGAFCRYHTQMPLRLSELAILVTAAWWQSQAEWQIHEPIARQAGLSDEVIEALRQGQAPEISKEDERLVYRIGRTLYETRRVDEALYCEAREQFGESALVELVGIFGYYALVAMTLNVFEVRRETSQPLPFAEPG
ncbi:carboxymuconolactone decarboxylase family protein [Marinobacterium aestuariivivens]|uniref:Carboxymuconolactone decarboxylase family protein n=2 Tax=Marinobacterium aestuariivivens TaxID=1698799 RepID=A0ABW2A579_9GAMM